MMTAEQEDQLPPFLRPDQPPERPEDMSLQIYLLTLEAAEMRNRMTALAALLRQMGSLLAMPEASDE